MRAAVYALHAIVPTVTLAFLMSAGVTSAPRELRVCADPNNLPFSNQKQEGFENKLADLIAADLGATVKYTWLRQRRGFVRRGLKAKECDLVTGIPTASEMVLATKPYYRSTYVFAYRKSANLQLRSFDDPALRKLRIGLHAIGEDGANPPPVHALARRGIINNVVGFRMFDVESIENPQGRIIDAVATGDIDVAIVWGPFAGYFAKGQKQQLEVVPVSPAIEPPGFPFVFEISMGVRPGETALKAEFDEILDRRRGDVRRILDEYGVPQVQQGESDDEIYRGLLITMIVLFTLMLSTAGVPPGGLTVTAADTGGSSAVADDDGNPIEGRRIFVRENCYSCHGGFAGGGFCPSLREDPPDESDVEDVIEEGTENGMPPFPHLNEEDIENLAAYFQTLRTRREPTFTHWWEPIPTQ